MGSKSRLVQKLRQTPHFPAMERYLDGLGLRWSINPPTGSGHPYLLIQMPDGREIKHSVACTPRSSTNPDATLSRLKRAMAR